MSKKLAIIGLGLIGGSIAKALSQRGYVVHGHDINPRSKIAALAEGAIGGDLERGGHYDAVIIALNASVILGIAEELPYGISADILIDASGLKSELSVTLGALVEKGVFDDYIGIHTMAGREVSGYENSEKDLFRGASCILTPSSVTKPDTVDFARGLALDLGCTHIVITEPETHDRIIAYTSQLAHVVSNTYVKSTAAFQHSGFTGGSYQDLTRVARLDTNMWSELFIQNRENLLPEIDGYIQNLNEVRQAIFEENREHLKRLLVSGSRKKIAADALSALKRELDEISIPRNVRLGSAKLEGSLSVPSSKSEAHRLIIAAALQDKDTHCTFCKLDISDDILATLSCVAELGAYVELERIHQHRADVRVGGIDRVALAEQKVNIEVIESAATLRLILPVAVALASSVTLRMGPALKKRPISPLLNAFKNHGIKITENESGDLVFSGDLNPGPFRIRGDISSQYISGLLFALPLLSEESEVLLTTNLESKGYLNMTLQVLSEFGVRVQVSENRYKIAGAQTYSSPAHTMQVAADYSSAAVWKIANALGANIDLQGLEEDSLQPDKTLDDLIMRFKNGAAPTTPIDISEAPDLLPVLAVLAGLSKGTTDFVNARRLRLKESDRLESVAVLLRSAGVGVELNEESMHITGAGAFQCAHFDTQADHRLVMAAALIASLCNGESVIADADSVSKSYPRFFLDLESLGGKLL